MPVLRLEVPKKVIQYSGANYLEEQNDSSIKMKPKVRGKRGPKPFRQSDRSTESASIYADNKKQEADSTNIIHPNKRIRKNENELIIEQETLSSHSDNNKQLAKIPTNFDIVAKEFFDYFWKLEFDDKEVNNALFAKITILNCKDFNLTTFADKSYCLPIIKERLEKNAYLAMEDFVFDFQQMFANILEFYPETHAAYQTAKELIIIFSEKWKEAKMKFKW